MNPNYFDDLHIGRQFGPYGATITEDAIIRFGLDWDPQPMHIDRVAADAGPHGGLIASGMHTLCLSFRLCVQAGTFTSSAIAGLGLQDVSFLQPVRPGTTIKVWLEVIDRRESRSRPNVGIVKWRMSTTDEFGNVLMTMTFTNMMSKRAITTDDPMAARIP